MRVDGLEAVVSAVKAALHEVGADLDHLVGAVVGIAAPVSVQGGRIAEPKLLPGWAEGRLAGHLADVLGVPVKLENTAALGALMRRPWLPRTVRGRQRDAAELGREDTGDGIDRLIDDALADAVGAYHEIDFKYTAGGYARTASIRTYDSLPVGAVCL